MPKRFRHILYQKEQNGPFFAFSWRFQKFLTALHAAQRKPHSTNPSSTPAHERRAYPGAVVRRALACSAVQCTSHRRSPAHAPARCPSAALELATSKFPSSSRLLQQQKPKRRQPEARARWLDSEEAAFPFRPSARRLGEGSGRRQRRRSGEHAARAPRGRGTLITSAPSIGRAGIATRTSWRDGEMARLAASRHTAACTPLPTRRMCV